MWLGWLVAKAEQKQKMTRADPATIHRQLGTSSFNPEDRGPFWIKFLSIAN
jgi:hypothetical protein